MWYDVLDPEKLFSGKSYSQWIEDFTNWFFSASPDAANTGPVRFLRSYPAPEKIAMLDPLSAHDPTRQIKYESSSMFKNYPNVMVGKDKLEVFDDETIMFPSMLAVYFATETSDDAETMRAWLKNNNDISDNPPSPDQILIDGNSITVNEEDMKKYRIETTLFNVRISDIQYPYSEKYFVQNAQELEQAGNYAAIVEGYFFMLKLNTVKDVQRHYVISHAKGARYSVGDYYATFVYQIDVMPQSYRSKPPLNRQGIPIPIRRRIEEELENKVKDKEIDGTERDKIMNWVKSIRKGEIQRSIADAKGQHQKTK